LLAANSRKPSRTRALFAGSILSVTLLCHAAAGAEPANWPQFRGPNGSGLSPDDQPAPLHFGPNTNRLWQTPLPRGHSSPCIWGDRIFVTGFDATNKSLETLCLERVNGKILWRKTAPALELEKSLHEFSSPAASTPATDGARVYLYLGGYGALAYDFKGEELWKRPLPMPPKDYGNARGVGGQALRSFGAPLQRVWPLKTDRSLV
jgi:outer membrane protein assembly factor BamB